MQWSILHGLGDAEVEQILALGRRRRFARREVIWHEGDRADTVHLIRSGRIGIQVITARGDVATVAVLGPGEAAGIIAVLASDPYHTTSAVALQPTESVAIRVDDLRDVARRFPAVGDSVSEYLSDRVIDLTRQLIDAHYVSADMRVLRRLVDLARLSDQGDTTIEIPLTQEDLAEIAGVTRPTVNRVLKKEQDRGTIKLSRGSITVTDKARLAERVE
jgi:CRP/FNR family cyclic AMP-dependent transcriptional regulator